ncbi:Predicted secreted periplasmic protein [Oceanicola granulosus HTCC2516]|uniref:Predicted secreted periplasmic protein n=1 Tax=Oceanicola granulosus (strain ATCC BAA-861 / DSM 15982 / KCTC 12143 / HTCC2516) TaxID=314256 RepID=Q2CBD2_OCEGH|nr:LPS assembly lipoprotein LptE [Oceanicola granulosus]EAR49966.1 Predicted secreted periplasmic protein [Oceanicola granulosus HTCC2516]
MSSCDGLSRRRALLGGALLALGACGFTPVHAPGGSAAALYGTVSVEAPATDEGFRLRERLIERLGAADAARYHLSVDLEIRDSPVSVSTEQATTRYNLPGAADFTLIDRTTGALVASGRVDTFTGYSATGTAVSTIAAARDARARLATALADLIVTRLYAAAPAR